MPAMRANAPYSDSCTRGTVLARNCQERTSYLARPVARVTGAHALPLASSRDNRRPQTTKGRQRGTSKVVTSVMRLGAGGSAPSSHLASASAKTMSEQHSSIDEHAMAVILVPAPNLGICTTREGASRQAGHRL